MSDALWHVVVRNKARVDHIVMQIVGIHFCVDREYWMINLGCHDAKVVICIVVVLVVVEQLGHGDAEGGCAGGCALHDLLAAGTSA